jgi:hypothetical protein
MFVIRVAYPAGHSIWLTRRFPTTTWGPKKDALRFPTEGCRPRDRAPPSLWVDDDRAYRLDTPKITTARKTRSTQLTYARSRLPESL